MGPKVAATRVATIMVDGVLCDETGRKTRDVFDVIVELRHAFELRYSGRIRWIVARRWRRVFRRSVALDAADEPSIVGAGAPVPRVVTVASHVFPSSRSRGKELGEQDRRERDARGDFSEHFDGILDARGQHERVAVERRRARRISVPTSSDDGSSRRRRHASERYESGPRHGIASRDAQVRVQSTRG